MSNCAIVGINWGDEGKGRMVDLIASDYDIVCRYQGGNNAGHTIVNEYGKFALHLIPSGICLPGVVNVLGNGVVIDLESLCGEIEALQNAGVPITPENFKISERATIVFPYHRALDGLEEARLKDKKYGSTLRGIAPVYSDKYQKKTIMMGELLYPAYLEKRLASILVLGKGLRVAVIVSGNAADITKLSASGERFTMEMTGKTTLLLGGSAQAHMFARTDLAYSAASQDAGAGMGYLVQDGHAVKLKAVQK